MSYTEYTREKEETPEDILRLFNVGRMADEIEPDDLEKRERYGVIYQDESIEGIVIGEYDGEELRLDSKIDNWPMVFAWAPNSAEFMRKEENPCSEEFEGHFSILASTMVDSLVPSKVTGRSAKGTPEEIAEEGYWLGNADEGKIFQTPEVENFSIWKYRKSSEFETDLRNISEYAAETGRALGIVE